MTPLPRRNRKDLLLGLKAPVFCLSAATFLLVALVFWVSDHTSPAPGGRPAKNAGSVLPAERRGAPGEWEGESPVVMSVGTVRGNFAIGGPHASREVGALPQSGPVFEAATGEPTDRAQANGPRFAPGIAAPRPPGSSHTVTFSPPYFTPAGANSRVTQAEVDALETGLGQVLAELEENLVDQVLTETLPLVGDRFAAAFDNEVAGFRYVNTLRTAIVGGLATLTAGPDYSPAQVASPINSRLTSSGFASGSGVTVTTVNDQVQLAFVTSDNFPAAAVPIGGDFGLPNLDLDLLSPASASCVVAVTLRFTAGVDGSGFYLETNAPNTLFTVNTTTTVSTTLNAPVRFANLPFRLNDRTSPRSNVTANFALTLLDPDNSGKIRNGELAGTPDLLDATVAGTAALNFTITSDLPVEAALPKIRTDLALSWGYSTARPVDPDDNNKTFGNAPALSLNNNSLQVSSFFKGFTRQVLRGIAQITGPLDELIAIFTTEIPLLSDLGSDKVTLLDIAGASPAERDALEALAKLASLSQLATGMTTADTIWANMGSFAWSGDLRTATLPDLQGVPTAPPANFSGDLSSFLTDADDIPGLAFPLLKTPAGAPNGQALANVLMGRSADLFTFSSEKITVQDGFNASFPVLGPIFVTLGGFAGVSAQFGFGFDTEGIFEYAAAGPNADPDMIFHGFYATAADENGDPFTGISVLGGITAGVEANIGIAAVGVEGDITLEVGLYLDSRMGENGRIRSDIFGNVPFEDMFRAAGSISAGLRVYVEVGVGPFSVGYDWDSPRAILINFDKRDDDVPVLAELDPVDPTKLILNVGTRAPRRLHGIIEDRAEEFTITGGVNGIAITFLEESNTFDAPALIIGNPNVEGDVIELASDVNVPARLHGGEGRDFLSGGAAADELHGDGGLDKLMGRGGNDTLRGGEGNDELVGGPGADILDGGPGEDTASWADSLAPITIDLRDSTFGGDAALDTLISIERYKGSEFADVIHGSEGFDGLLNGDRGNDLIHGHGGDDLIEGSAGDDTLFGDGGNDLINGGYGADTMDGGDGTDTLSYLSPSPNLLLLEVVLEPVTINLQTGLGTRGEAAGDVVSGFEILIGSAIPAGVTSAFGSGDDLTGSDNGETILGMGGADLIHGGGGNDILYGDTPDAIPGSIVTFFDADTIYGDAGDDQIFGQADNDKLYGGDGNDALDGGEGDDTLDAGAGNDTLFGAIGNDHLLTMDPAGFDVLDGGLGYNRLSADYSDKTTPLNFTVGPVNAHTFPDGDQFTGIHSLGALTTGSASDVIRLSAAAEPFQFHKTIHAGTGDDLVIADWRGLYSAPAGSGRSNDSLHGDDGNDTVSFEQSVGGVSINLGTNAVGGSATGITISGFENVIGTNHIDTLTGDAGPNIFMPLRGGPAGGSDFVNGGSVGGDGVDTLRVDYSSDERVNAEGITMTPNATSGAEPIALGPAWDVGGNLVILYYLGIERFEITGGAARDRLYGEDVYGSYPDIFIGLGGNDQLESRGGDDFLDGGDGNDTLNAGGGHDTIFGGTGNDIITFLRHTTDFNQGWLGTDTLDAGPGDDVVTNLWAAPGSGAPGANAETGAVFRADGGSGYDTLNADFNKQSLAIIFDQAHPSDTNFPNGSYIRGFESLKDFVSGSGNDVFTFRGRENSRIQMFGGNDIINPGLGIDIAYGGTGNDLLIIDYSAGDDANAGGITSASASVHTRADVNTGAVLDRVTTAEMERSHITGTSKADTINGQTGDDMFFGRGGTDTLDGANGNDYLDGGPGADQMWGGPGNDNYVVDNTGDTVRELNTSGFDQGGLDTVRSSVSLTLPTALEILNLTGAALNGTGNSSANTITGNTQNNLLQGLNGNDTLNGGGGPNEVDRLNGGANADTFVLGDGSVRFFDDGDPLSPGLNGYAVIEDFTPAQTDRLRLTGSAAQYFLGVSPINGLTGTALYHDSNASGVLDANDELIAILASAETLTPANTLGSAVIVSKVPLASAGVTSDPQGLLFDSGAGKLMHLQFTMVEPGVAGVIIEIMASDDLGINEPWTTIASKTGSAAWTGYGAVTVGLPVDGQVIVRVADIMPASAATRRFMRLKVTVP